VAATRCLFTQVTESYRLRFSFSFAGAVATLFCPLQKVTSTSEPVPCHSTLYSPGARVVPACSVCEADDPEGVGDGSAEVPDRWGLRQSPAFFQLMQGLATDADKARKSLHA